jgi:quinoprotein relay system zinc metallohydrolase 2
MKKRRADKTRGIKTLMFRKNEKIARRKNLLVGALLAAGILAARPDLAYTPPFNLEEVAPGNYVHLGKQVHFEDHDHDDIANIGFIVGDKCVAVIDTGGSVTVGEALRAAIHEKTKLPVCYVINTHVHPDHILGNVAFRDDKPVFVGSATLPPAVAANRDYFLKQFGKDLGTDPKPDEIIAPDKLVKIGKPMELDLGGRKLLLTAYPPAHTTADLTVLDESTDTLWLGDLLFIERIPAVDGSVKGWLKVIDSLEKQKHKIVIPGHGPVTHDMQAALADEHRYLQTLVDGVRKVIAAGGTIEDAMDTVGAKEKLRWKLWDQHHRLNVSRTFTQLEWE